MRKKVTLGLMFALLMVRFPGGLYGEDHSLVLSIGAREEYNDNLFYSASKKEEDFVTTVSPKIKWAIDTETTNASASAGLDRIMYRQNDELDKTDQLFGANASQRLNERFSAAAQLNYLKDSRRERDLETTGLLQNDSLRKNWQFGVSGNYLISEEDAVDGSVSFEQENYENVPTSDYDSWSGTIVYSRSFNPETRWSTQLGYTSYNYDLSDIGNYWVSTGINRKINETITLDAQIGGRFTRTEQTESRMVILLPSFIPVLQTEKVTNDSSGLIGNLGITFKGEYSSLDISANHDVKNASGRNGTTNRTAFVVSVNQQLTDAWFIYCSGGYYINEANAGELATADIDERTFQIQPRIRYRINRHLSLDSAFRYTQIENRTNDSTLRNSTLMMQLEYSYDLLE
ncbi:MAG: hypothetical protein V2B19_05095 [Pseudomonadota bacterium]